MQIFIIASQDDNDQETARKLYHAIQQGGISPWLESEDLLPGQNRQAIIRQTIQQSRYVLVLLSHNALSEKGFVQKDIKFALDILDEFPDSEIFIIPIYLELCRPLDERLQNLHGVNLYSSYQNGLQQILRVLVPDQENGQSSDKILSSGQAGEFSEIESHTSKDAGKTTKTILILAANPEDTPYLRLDKEVREIDEGLRRAKHRETFVIHQKWAVTLKDLRRALLDYEPQIVHFCGHGNVDGLKFEDETGNTALVKPGALSGLFELFPQIECVLLNACYSETQAEAIRNHIPYVIGMSNEIGDEAAVEFAVGFYDALGGGRYYEDAFRFGCNAIQLYGLPDHLTPVLRKKRGLTIKVQIIFEEDIENFNETTRNKLLNILAAILEIDRDSIKILQVIPGSIRVIIDLPSKSAQKLIELFTAKSKHIKELTTQYRVSAIELIDIKEIERLTQIEFVNRLNEIAFITNIFCPPYLLINAPAGYGKTRLIETVRTQLESQNWLCMYLELSRDTSYTIQDIAYTILQQLGVTSTENLDLTTPEKAGYEIGTWLVRVMDATQNQVTLLIDEIEALKKALPQKLLNRCIVAIKEVLDQAAQSIRLRIIFAGRHISHWKRLDSRIPLELMPLTPFDFAAVYQTVENFAAKSGLNMSQEYKEEFAAYLMHFTGGHPGCMVNILSKSFGKPISLIVSNESEYYETVVKSVITEIRSNIPQALRDIFEKLSMFRRYNYSLLEKMIENNAISYSGNVVSLEGELTATYLVDRKRGFIQDDIIRRLFFIKQRKEVAEETFVKYCSKASQTYEDYLKEATDQPYVVAIDALYQELQWAYYQSDRTPRARNMLYEQFFAEDTGILQKYLRMLLKKQNARGILANLLKELLDRTDWEFQFTLNFFLRRNEHYTDEPYQRLLKEVDSFITQHS